MKKMTKYIPQVLERAVRTLVGLRVWGLAADSEDLNDHDALEPL